MCFVFLYLPLFSAIEHVLHALPLTTRLGKCHILKSRNSGLNQDWNPHFSIGGRLGKQTCYPLHDSRICLLVGCLTFQQHAGVSQRRICSDNFTCCHTEIEVADPTFYLTQSQYTDTGPTSPSADPIMPGAWQGSHWSANFSVTGMTRKNPVASGIQTPDLQLPMLTP